jgi:hypothetical protein
VAKSSIRNEIKPITEAICQKVDQVVMAVVTPVRAAKVAVAVAALAAGRERAANKAAHQ